MILYIQNLILEKILILIMMLAKSTTGIAMATEILSGFMRILE
jgi:hypothetical protein